MTASTTVESMGPVNRDSSAWKMVGGELPRPFLSDEHKAFAESARRFIENELRPSEAQWHAQGIVDREAFNRCGDAGIMGFAIPEEYGGAGIDDFRFNMVLNEEFLKAECPSISVGVCLHNDVCVPYLTTFCNEEQKQRWLPGCASGEILLAVAMTEPGTGSDLQAIATTAVLDGDHYIVNGAKTFITNGINSDLVITAVKTENGLSLLGIERDTPGFERGRKLEKLGMHGQDTSELFFNDCRVPKENLIGEEGQGFIYLVQKLVQERLSLITGAIGGAEAALGYTIDYVRERKAFGKPIGSFQNTRFKLAELKTEVTIGRIFANWAVDAFTRGELTVEQVAMGKWWLTDLLNKVADEGLQLHGGYGYMMEYPIARAWADARITKIFAGTNEIMKEVIGRTMELS